jgi:hypothetical protein
VRGGVSTPASPPGWRWVFVRYRSNQGSTNAFASVIEGVMASSIGDASDGGAVL